MAFRALRIPLGRFLWQQEVLRRNYIRNVRHYFGRKEIFGELSNTLQSFENRVHEMEKFFHEFHKPSRTVFFPRFMSPFKFDDVYDMPIIKTKDGQRVYHLEVDVNGLDPKDVTITLKDNVLTISGKKEDKGKDSHFSREYCYRYSLPDGVNPDTIKSIYQNGILSVEAPLPPDSSSKEPIEIPIQKDNGSENGSTIPKH